jgi:hypothetical protein
MKIPGYDHVVFNHQERNLGSLVDMKIPRYVAAKLLLLLADIWPKEDYSEFRIIKMVHEPCRYFCGKFSILFFAKL